MVHYIRDEKNRTLLDLEVFTLDDGRPDLSSSVDIDNYTNFLLSLEGNNKRDTARVVFSRLSEARGWYWEVFRETINENPTKADVDEAIGLMVRSGAEVLGLNYVTD